MCFGWWLWPDHQRSVPLEWSTESGKDLGRQTKGAVPWKPRGDRSAVSVKEEDQITWRLTADSDGLLSVHLCPRDVGKGPGHREEGSWSSKPEWCQGTDLFGVFQQERAAWAEGWNFPGIGIFLGEKLQERTRLEVFPFLIYWKHM